MVLRKIRFARTLIVGFLPSSELLIEAAHRLSRFSFQRPRLTSRYLLFVKRILLSFSTDVCLWNTSLLTPLSPPCGHQRKTPPRRWEHRDGVDLKRNRNSFS